MAGSMEEWIPEDKIVVYAILFALAGAPKAMYSFTCCPDSSVVERHLGKMEVPGSIPGRGSVISPLYGVDDVAV